MVNTREYVCFSHNEWKIILDDVIDFVCVYVGRMFMFVFVSNEIEFARLELVTGTLLEEGDICFVFEMQLKHKIYCVLNFNFSAENIKKSGDQI